MLVITLLTLLVSITCVEFNWLQFNDKFDSIVGIVYDKKPVSVGVFITNELVLTSANPIQHVYEDSGKLSKLLVYAINGEYNESKAYAVDCVCTPYLESRQKYWIKHGTDNKHSPMHDILVIRVTEKAWDIEEAPQRMPYWMKVAKENETHIQKYWSYAGFGYIDKQHVHEMFELEMEGHSKPILIDCDEFIPRQWGIFICLENVNGHAGIHSGSPLFHKHYVFGIGSFSLSKGIDNILVFTDVRPYMNRIGFCKGQNQYHEWINETYQPKIAAEI